MRIDLLGPLLSAVEFSTGSNAPDIKRPGSDVSLQDEQPPESSHLVTLWNGERSRDPAAAAFTSAQRGRRTARAPVNAGNTAGEIDDQPAAIESIAAANQRNIAGQCDDPPVEVIDRHFTACGFAAAGDNHAAGGVEPLDLERTQVGIGNRGAAGSQPQIALTLWGRSGDTARRGVARGDWITMQSYPVRRADVDREGPIEITLRPVR